MPEPRPETLQDLAIEVRSKNAGPFWVTMEVFPARRGAHAAADPPSSTRP